MKVNQYHTGNQSKIWTVLTEDHEFEFDLDGTLICALNLNGVDPTRDQIFEAIKFYDNN